MKFEILIKQQLSKDRLGSFGGLEQDQIIQNNQKFTRLSGDIVDQTALITVLKKMNNLGIVIVSINQSIE